MEKQIRAVIIDDEQMARDSLRGMIGHYCPQIEVVGEAGGVQEGMREILKLSPDLVFLDIQMNDGTGFELLGMFPELNFSVIFTTAHDQYAIRAIEFSAQGYLLKPIGGEELVAAVNRSLNRAHNPAERAQLSQYFTQPSNNSRIVVSTQEGLHVIDIQDIVRLRGDNAYTIFHLVKGSAIVVAKSLKQYDKLLSPEGFFRVSISNLVNLNQVSLVRPGRGGSVELKDGTEISISRNRRKDLMDALERYLKA